MLCNLWHIKQTNGLFYYALDYVRAVDGPTLVLVRPALQDATRRELPHHDVRAVSTSGILGHLLRAMILRRWVFTPTSHPFPLHNRQLIVVHDGYPFLGRKGRLKRRLFRVSLWSSCCQVGHINHSTSLHAVPTDIVSRERLWYMPNQGPEERVVQELRLARERTILGGAPSLTDAKRMRIALFGSDSRKKRYEDLFAQCERAGGDSRLSLLIYGHPTDYYRELCERFPSLDIKLVPSSEVRMENFLCDIDGVASVAEHEGFGRPIALALAAGIPCFLLASPVFAEFFGRSTRLYASTEELVQALLNHSHGSTLTQRFEELPQIRTSFRSAAQRLAAVASRGKVAV